MLDDISHRESDDIFFRTDQDIIARGFDYYCCKKWTGKSYVTCETTGVAHQDCRPINETGRNSTLNATRNTGIYEDMWPSCPGVVKPKKSDSAKITGSSVAFLFIWCFTQTFFMG